MRVFAGVLVVAVILGLAARPTTGQARDAAQVLASAREALGGEKSLSAVRGFVASGRTRQVRGNNLVPIEFEINCALPDRFVRTDEIPAQDTAPSTVGFNGDLLVQVPPPRTSAGGPPPLTQQRVLTLKQDFARVMLGLFAGSFPSYPLTFKYVAEGAAPEGKADILDVTGPSNFSARLVVQQSTHLPVLLIWQLPSAGQATPVEYRMYYGDYRSVGSVKWPFRIRRSIGGETVEETTFDRFRLNVNIDAKKFEAPK